MLCYTYLPYQSKIRFSEMLMCNSWIVWIRIKMRGKHIMSGLDDEVFHVLHIHMHYIMHKMIQHFKAPTQMQYHAVQNVATINSHRNSYAVAENRLPKPKNSKYKRWAKSDNIKPYIHGTLKPHIYATYITNSNEMIMFNVAYFCIQFLIRNANETNVFPIQHRMRSMCKVCSV